MSITKIAEVANNVLDKFVQDKDLKEKLTHDLQKELISLDKAQISLNAAEAKTGTGLYQAGDPSLDILAVLLCAYTTLYCLQQLG